MCGLLPFHYLQFLVQKDRQLDNFLFGGASRRSKKFRPGAHARALSLAVLKSCQDCEYDRIKN